MEDFRFSVWTPTFNRAPFLDRLYESLKQQSFKDFEWITVDDGSEDNTSIFDNLFLGVLYIPILIICKIRK
jgi:glycosyltransferase involved in cell wall biosynthesis